MINRLSGLWQEVHPCISSSEARGGSREKLRTPGSWGKGNARQRQHVGDQEEARQNRRKHHTESLKECTSWKGPKPARTGGCLVAQHLEAKTRSGLKTTADKWSLPFSRLLPPSKVTAFTFPQEKAKLPNPSSCSLSPSAHQLYQTPLQIPTAEMYGKNINVIFKIFHNLFLTYGKFCCNMCLITKTTAPLWQEMFLDLGFTPDGLVR